MKHFGVALPFVNVLDFLFKVVHCETFNMFGKRLGSLEGVLECREGVCLGEFSLRSTSP